MPRELKNLLVHHLVGRALRDVCPRVKGRLIDIGCGSKPYEKLLCSRLAEHIGVDLPTGGGHRGRADCNSGAYELPFDDASFDSALCTAVLEHLEEPETALRECVRVLKPGGMAIYTVPFFWHLHEEPRDFYRYTRYGIDYLFTKAGFRVEETRPLSGFWVTFGQMFVYYLYRFNRGPLRWLGLIPLAGLVVQGAAYVLHHIERSEQWTWMYLVVARKPERKSAAHE